jgi:hypothetical protein
MFRTTGKLLRVTQTLTAIMLFAAVELSASEIEYLKNSESFCDTTGEVCLRGTISYRVNSRVLQLRARLVKASGPGRLLIGVTGVNRLGYPRRADIEIDIRGNYSEIVRTEMIPDAPDVYSWELDTIRFVAKE